MCQKDTGLTVQQIFAERLREALAIYRDWLANAHEDQMLVTVVTDPDPSDERNDK
jgi:hypothetical protein